MSLALISPETKLPAAFPSPSVLAMSLVDYFSRPEEVMEEQVIFLRDGETEKRMVPRLRPMPIIEEWCATNRITRRQLEVAASVYAEIAEALEFARDTMKVYLIRKGLTEQYNPQFAKFVATNETSMVERSEHINKNLNVNGADLLDEIERASKPIRR